MSWGFPYEQSFSIEDQPFSSEGFRKVYRAKSNGKEYVVKNFLEKTLTEANNVNLVVKTKETETLSRKAIQCHMLAKERKKERKIKIAAKKEDFKAILAKAKEKRIVDTKAKPKVKNTRELEYLTVQRLSANVEGKAQKYSRIRALTMVK